MIQRCSPLESINQTNLLSNFAIVWKYFLPHSIKGAGSLFCAKERSCSNARWTVHRARWTTGFHGAVRGTHNFVGPITPHRNPAVPSQAMDGRARVGRFAPSRESVNSIPLLIFHCPHHQRDLVDMSFVYTIREIIGQAYNVYIFFVWNFSCPWFLCPKSNSIRSLVYCSVNNTNTSAISTYLYTRPLLLFFLLHH